MSGTIVHHTSHCSRCYEPSCCYSTQHDSPSWKKCLNSDGTLLRPVGEVVVSCGEVIVGSSANFLKSSIKLSSLWVVQLSTVLIILVIVTSILDHLQGLATTRVSISNTNLSIELVQVAKEECCLCIEH